ncbi:hypothetical protein MCEMSHM24_02491 [Comamonadaceae bacterium]|jgi:hypothetical protein
MRPVDNLDLVRWREMDSIHVLRLLADHIKEDPSFHPRSSPLTTRWHAHVAGHDWEFLCAGPKFLDVRMDRGGGGAVDLAMHIYGLKFKAAAKLLKVRGI